MRNRTWALLTLLGLVLFGSQYFPISCTDQLRLSTTSSLSGPSSLLILLKTTGQLCPKIQVGLFRFYFLNLSSNYQKGFSSLFSNCWKVPTTSNFPSPGTENSYTQIKCLNQKQRSHFSQSPCLSGLRLLWPFINMYNEGHSSNKCQDLTGKQKQKCAFL